MIESCKDILWVGNGKNFWYNREGVRDNRESSGYSVYDTEEWVWRDRDWSKIFKVIKS